MMAILSSASACRADFQYTETTTITGGAVSGLMKFASRLGGGNAGPTVTTYQVKGNRMRIEHGNGQAEIIDLDRHLMITLDEKKRTYSSITFEQMRAQLDSMRQRPGLSPEGWARAKVTVTPMQNTRVILGQSAHEVQTTVSLQSQNGDAAGPSGNMTFDDDMWLAPSVTGYDEVRSFYVRMANETNWGPGGLSRDPRAAQAFDEINRHTSELKGFPLAQSVKLYAATPPAPSKNHGDPYIPNASVPSSKTDVMNQALSGMIGFGRHRQQQRKEQTASGEANDSPSLMTSNTEVTSFSSAPIDDAVFAVPPVYRELSSGQDHTGPQ
jgi:hypothetical protein